MLMQRLQSDESKRQQYFKLLLPSSQPDDDPNRLWLAKILASWLNGESVLPNFLGLESAQFQKLCHQFFPHLNINAIAVSRKELDYSRMLEKDDLIALLVHFRKDDSEVSKWLIGLVVSACLGNDHLWQDLGFWQRSDLSEFLNHNFPELAARNTKDMKWKKFLYKQLCEAEGIYLCRAPSCEVCTDYSNCFGPEEN